MRQFVRLFVVVAVVAVVPVVSTTAGAATSRVATTCSAADTTLSATPDHSVYAWGATVRVMVALHNRSARACSFAVGPSSPSFTLTNASGTTVWGSCWFGGRPAPCAEFLMQRTLAPGATYRVRLTWDQRSGHPDVPVAAGRYRFDVMVTDSSLHATTTFVLTRPSSVTTTVNDSGRTYSLPIGGELTVVLPTSGVLRWSSPQSSDAAILSLVTGATATPGVAVFRAVGAGLARVTATGTPVCYPQCLMPSRLFVVTVSVRAT